MHLVAGAGLTWALAACSRTVPTPPISDTTPVNSVIAHGDTDAAVANARAALAELEQQKVDNAAAGADLLEGILNEDPRLIGEALARLAKNLPKKAPAR